MDQNEEAFCYNPLSVTKRQIRLLQIRYVDDTPSLDLSVHDLEDAPEYRALSYTWGSPNPTFRVFVNDQPFAVRHNLFTFLQKMASMFAGFLEAVPEFCLPYFWIDQICIDQSNIAERNNHVRYMSQIYSTADSVFIWLADTDMSRGQVVAAPPTDPRIHVIETLLTMEDIAGLLSDPYFSRLWVVQEMILSQARAIYIPGNAAIFFDTIADACTFQREALEELGVAKSTIAILSDVSWSIHQNAPLGSWIAKYNGQLCADPRDKVYGFLRLVGVRKKVVVNYEKPVHEVFLEVTMLFYETFLATVVDLRWQQFEYPTEPVEYYDTLQNLSKEMGIDGPKLRGLLAMLREIWNPEYEYMAVDGGGKPAHPPVTAMGYESTNASKTSKDMDAKGKGCSGGKANRWWYECEGKKHYFACDVQES